MALLCQSSPSAQRNNQLVCFMSNRVDYVSSRAVISGQYVEVYDYSKPLCIGFKFSKEINKCFPKIERRPDQTEITAQNMRRTRKEITRLVNCNQHLIKFRTLTFAENKTNLPSANKLFDLFIQRLKLRYPDFEFVCAIEFNLQRSPFIGWCRPFEPDLRSEISP